MVRDVLDRDYWYPVNSGHLLVSDKILPDNYPMVLAFLHARNWVEKVFWSKSISSLVYRLKRLEH